jgi:hypothetical protein
MKRKILLKIWAIPFLAILSVVCVLLFFVALNFSPFFVLRNRAEIMRNLNSDETKASLRNMFDRDYNFTELYQWEHSKVRFAANEDFERSTDPLRILQVGKGRCGEFSVLYVALCLSHGYESRFVVAVDMKYWVLWFPQHEWAEVKLNDQWVHVDPSDQVWNASSHYRTWPWADGIGSTVRILAFEEGKITDITESYEMAEV